MGGDMEDQSVAERLGEVMKKAASFAVKVGPEAAIAHNNAVQMQILYLLLVTNGANPETALQVMDDLLEEALAS